MDIEDVAIDSSGAVVMVGSFLSGSTILVDGLSATAVGLEDIFIVKLDKDGNGIWIKTLAATSNAVRAIEGIGIDPDDNIIIAGTAAGVLQYGGGHVSNPLGNNLEAFVAKLDPDGNHLWNRRYGQNDETTRVWDVAVGPSGEVVVAGDYTGSPDFGGGQVGGAPDFDAFLLKLDADGVHRCSFGIGGNGEEQPRAVSIGPTGEIAMVGYHDHPVSFGGPPVGHAGQSDAFAALFNDQCALQFSHGWGGMSGDRALDAGFLPDGQLAVVGYFEGSVNVAGTPLSPFNGRDGFLVVFEPNGEVSWVRSYAGFSDQSVTALAVDGSGTLVAGGTYSGSFDAGLGQVQVMGDGDIFFVKLSGDGTPLWQQGFGDAAGEDVFRVDARGEHVMAVGMFEGSIDFGGGSVNSTGGDDGYVVSFAR